LGLDSPRIQASEGTRSEEVNDFARAGNVEIKGTPKTSMDKDREIEK